MLTQCPQCGVVYRLHAEVLSAAQGFVTCDACDQVFNALSRLADEPVIPSTAIAPPAIEPPSAPPHIKSAPLTLDDVPAVLRGDVERLLHRQRLGLHGVWRALAVFAAGVLLVQIAWDKREWVFDHYPQVKPYAAQLCDHLACRLERPHGLPRIELLARDVREHPEYVGTLLVNATLVNRGRTVANYPVIQLGVYDRNGRVVGIRRFAPREYLDQSIDINAGMPSGRSVHVVLEVANASDVAESFEFIFL
jgi:predicted Zn finger-like uncharacterized protein